MSDMNLVNLLVETVPLLRVHVIRSVAWLVDFTMGTLGLLLRNDISLFLSYTLSFY